MLNTNVQRFSKPLEGNEYFDVCTLKSDSIHKAEQKKKNLHHAGAAVMNVEGLFLC